MSDIRDAQLRVVPSYWTAEAYRSAWEEVPVSFERHTFGRYSFVLTVIFQVLFCVCSTSDDLLVQVQPFMIVNITRYRSMYDAALFTVMRTYAACSGPVHCACCVSLQMILLIISSLFLANIVHLCSTRTACWGASEAPSARATTATAATAAVALHKAATTAPLELVAHSVLLIQELLLFTTLWY
jgi:hypothetical protein